MNRERAKKRFLLAKKAVLFLKNSKKHTLPPKPDVHFVHEK